MTLAESVKITRALELMSSLERVKQERRFCNFTVKVDNHSFEVDKNVMVASSPYFEALFSSQMGEVNAGVVDMKEVDANAIKLSIGFIYSGEAKLDMDSIQHVLHAGNLLQISLLLNLCFGHMQDHLSPQNCIKVMLLADSYSNEGLNKKAYEVLTSKLKDVINSGTLPNLCRSNLLRCLKDCEADYKTIWSAVVSWVKGQNQKGGNLLSDIFIEYGFEKFPVKFLFETVLEEQNDVNFKKFVTDAIFSDLEKLEEEISDDVDVCFKLKNSLEMLSNDGSAKDSILIKFFVKNAANVFKRTEFLDMNDRFVSQILQEGNCAEELKFDALLRWTKHVKQRKKHFSKLFMFIKLETLSLEFLKQKVQSEILVKESPDSYESLKNTLFQMLEKKNSSETSTSPNAGERAPPGAVQIQTSTNTPTNSEVRAPSSVSQRPSTSTSTNSGVRAPSSATQRPSTSTSSNAGRNSSGANKVPSSNPSCATICGKCTKPIPDGRGMYFHCCNVHVHWDCMDWHDHWMGIRRAQCPKCLELLSFR